MTQYYQDGKFKIVYVVNEYSYGLYKEKCLGVFEDVFEALTVCSFGCRIEVELREND